LVKCQIQGSAEAGEIIVDIVLDKGGDSWRPDEAPADDSGG
jgi:hypothetical protein